MTPPTKELSFSKHSAVSAAFGQHFVKTGIFKEELHHMLIDAFEERNESDYGMTFSLTEKDASQALQRARIYCETLTTYLQKNKYLAD